MDPNLDKLVQELNEATAADAAEAKEGAALGAVGGAPYTPRQLRPVPVDTSSKADKLIALARGSYVQVSEELALARRNHATAYVNILHDAEAEINRIKESTKSKLENLEAETGREIRKMEDLLELYAKIKF